MSRKRDTALLPIVTKLEIFQLIKEMMLVGFSKSEIRTNIQNQVTKELSDTEFENIYLQSIDHFQSNLVETKHIRDVIDTHIIQYEEIYRMFDELDYLPGKLACLAAKEKLLGFHQQNNTLEFNQNNTTIIEQESVYDVSKLTQEEREELNTLLQKVIKC